MQIRAQFQLPDDLTEEEKLEPVRNFGDDPKIRLLNRLYEKKRRVCALELCSLCAFLRRKQLKYICIVFARNCSERPCNTDLCTLVMVSNKLMGTARACRR